MKLDRYQKKVVKCDCKNLLVVAGAGSGKTFTIVQKIKYLISKGIKSDEILCISFTKAAALSLKNKLKEEGVFNEVKTFHGLGFQIIKSCERVNLVSDTVLRDFVLKYVDNFDNLDVLCNAFFMEFGSGDSKILKNEILRNSKYKMYLVYTIVTFINLFKGNNSHFENFFRLNKKVNNFRKQKRHKIFLNLVKKIYIHYEDYLRSSNLIDFHDMINKAIEVIKKDGIYPYKYVIIDEYQDVSLNKCELIRTIQISSGCKVMAVGDDWQSIYRFTGSDINVFIDFKNYFYPAKIIKLKRTYRNCNELLKVTSSFITKNPYQIRKRVKSYKHLDKPIEIFYYDNDVNEVWSNICLEGKTFILGRNNKDVKMVPFISSNMKFMTVHKSKGLESDNVIVLNLENKVDGFPSKILPSEFLMYFSGDDNYAYAEERRLFYVALTRSKGKVVLLVKRDNPSIFIYELIKNYKKYIKIS